VPTPGGTQNERLVNSYAKPPRVVPITRLVAEKVVILRDAAGGEMVLLDAEPRTAVITSTWAAWVGVVDHAGQLVARGIKGSDFLKAVQQCELDLVMHDGDADAAKHAAVVHAAPDQAPRALTGEQKELWKWSCGLVKGMGERMFDAAGGVGFARARFDASGWFGEYSYVPALVPPPATPVSALSPVALSMLSHLHKSFAADTELHGHMFWVPKDEDPQL
jgi:hypothetical protein